MGRSKRRNKLQLKRPNSRDRLNLLKVNDGNYNGDSSDDMNSENLESYNNNPALLNHINDIQNVNESILLWNDDDIADKNRNVIFRNTDLDLIRKSIKHSPFFKYLTPQLNEIEKINVAALSGMIISLPQAMELQSKDALNEISNINCKDIDTKKIPIENLIISEDEMVSNNIENRMELITPTTSPSQQLRRSSRCKKINYLEMINTPIIDQPHISPTRRLKQSTKVTVEDELHIETVTEMIDKVETNDENDKESPTINGSKSPEISPNKVVPIRDYHVRKSPGTKCIMCHRCVFATRSFSNVCYKCSCTAKRIMSRVKSRDYLVCITDPPCWQQQSNSVCDACTMQNFVQHGLRWGSAFSKYQSVTIDELRSAESVEHARLVRCADQPAEPLMVKQGEEVDILPSIPPPSPLALLSNDVSPPITEPINIQPLPTETLFVEPTSTVSLDILASDVTINQINKLDEQPNVVNDRRTSRHRRTIKPTQYNDYIVDGTALSRLVSKRANSTRKPAKRRSQLAEEQEMMECDTAANVDLESAIDYQTFITMATASANATKECQKEDNQMDQADDEPQAPIESPVAPLATSIGQPNEPDMEIESIPILNPPPPPIDPTPKPSSSSTPNRRIKRAFSSTVENNPSPITRVCGPRVKQVSRQIVNAEVNFDSTIGTLGPRQKCVVKRTNRITKRPDKWTNYVTDQPGRPESPRSPMDQPNIIEPFDGSVPLSPHTPSIDAVGGDAEDRCGLCEPCKRNRRCGKCDGCVLNKNQRRKTEICQKMVCTNTDHQQRILAKLSSISCNLLNDSTDRSVDEILPAPSVTNPSTASSKSNVICGKNTLDIYRDSDSDDLSSEEEQLDPELDNVHILQGAAVVADTVSRSGYGGNEGGFAVITSFKAQPNKVLCFSCGSGGDQMIHCVSCAEPFHFFCIEFQFRPKSKELFLCRNCTRCHACEGFASDLKCVKCQLAFHPGCVDRYPPSRSDDKGDWACYKCAMCLHCGAKAEDAMMASTNTKAAIDWSKDPWQCGRCARARRDGHVCPECGRAYQMGLETLECCICLRMVHRQCSGLTEDEFEIFKLESTPSDISRSFSCSKCVPPPPPPEVTSTLNVVDSETRLSRAKLSRQCKESDLKKYCERGVSRRMSEFIQKGETHEEMLLEQHKIADNDSIYYNGTRTTHCLSMGQLDGADGDECDDCNSGSIVAEAMATSSPLIPVHDDATTSVTADQTPSADLMNHTNSTICNSSESIGEYDMEQLSTVDIDTVAKDIDAVPLVTNKNGIFSRLNGSDFLSPKHMLMEALAKINIKMSRYPSRSAIHDLYGTLMVYLKQLTDQIFPWIDFAACLEWVQSVTRRNSGRMKLVLQTIYDYVRDNITREFDVFSSSITDIEQKLANSFQKGREDFIIFHSEQHLIALMKNLETRSPDNVQYTSYRLAFETEDKHNTVCEKDVRICALCGYSGDDGLEGRLIYGGLDVWVHVNCALWSDEVYEKEDGALVNVDAAIKRGETTICSSCNNFGATIRCSASDCLDGYSDACGNIYHFGCAFNLLTDPVFTESRTFYCSEMHDINDQDQQQQHLTLADMLILRRIYLPQGCLGSVTAACPSWIPSEQVVVSIGNLRIDCLGKLDVYSDLHKLYLCPISYKARRLFWSMDELDSLVMYYMSIALEQNKQISASDAVNSQQTISQQPQSIASVSSTGGSGARRRRMIETASDSNRGFLKRSKLMECNRQEVVYEMDDYGNLRPIPSIVPTASKRGRPIISESPMAPESAKHVDAPTVSRKANRRFPMNKQQDREAVVNDKVKPQIRDQCLTNGPVVQSPLPPQQQPMQVIAPQPPPPITLINAPRQIVANSAAVINRFQPQTTALVRPPQRIVKIMKVSSLNSLSQANSVSNDHLPRLVRPPPAILSSAQLPRKPIRIIKATSMMPINNHHSFPDIRQTAPTIQPFHPPVPSLINGSSPSVLRTVLTDTRSLSNNRPRVSFINGQSPYLISSCGSLSSLASPPAATNQLSHQYDGETADDCSLIIDSAGGPDSEAGSLCCSEQDSMSTISRLATLKTKATTIPSIISMSSVQPAKPSCSLSATRPSITSASLHQAVGANNGYSYCLRFIIHGFKGSKTPKSSWTYLVRKVTQMRKNCGMVDYSLKTSDGWTKFGLDQRHVVYLIEQMVNAFRCTNYEFKFHKRRALKLRDQCTPDVPSPHGCARFTSWVRPEPPRVTAATDPLAFLHCKANRPPRNHAPDDMVEPDGDEDGANVPANDEYLHKLALQFRNLHNGSKARQLNVRVCCSTIHGRGLFARRTFEPHEVIIEYVGDVIRSILSDVRECHYQKSGIDCYMFRLDQDYIVDATFKGNAARFINHSCRPNCYAKVVRFEGEKHIIIIAQRRIYKGEELTYNYRFPIEDDKLACTCGSFSCKKYLN